MHLIPINMYKVNDKLKGESEYCSQIDNKTCCKILNYT